jgi:hypothetical protein
LQGISFVRKIAMTKYAGKIGAILFLLWGLLHITGGAMMLMAGNGAYCMVATGLSPNQLPTTPGIAEAAIISFHSFNLLWLGVLVSIIAISNWKGNGTGLFINSSIVVMADIGLYYFLLMPGIMNPSDGLAGPVLAVGAILFGVIGVLKRN